MVCRVEGHLNSPGAQRVLRSQEKDAVRQRRVDLGEVLSTPSGRRFVWGLLSDDMKVFSATVSNDALVLARDSGVRLVGVQLLQRAQQEHPESFLAMWREAIGAAAEAHQRREEAKSVPRPNDVAGETGKAVTVDDAEAENAE